MLDSKPKKRAALAVALLLSGAAALWALTSATFVFDFAGDPGDNGDGPQYDVTGVGPIDDGTGCDEVVMVMVDPTGAPLDIDPFCLSLVDGTGSDDGDYGTINSPVASPATYTLFDVDAADVAALSGISQSDPAYIDYLVANADCLTEHTLAVDGLPTDTPFQFCFAAPIVQEIPTLGGVGLAALAALVAAAGLAIARRRRLGASTGA
jgi:hypothetical protein